MHEDIHREEAAVLEQRPSDSKATISAARADKTTRRHGRASQGRAEGAGSGRRPIGNGGGGHGDLLEDGEAHLKLRQHT